MNLFRNNQKLKHLKKITYLLFGLIVVLLLSSCDGRRSANSSRKNCFNDSSLLVKYVNENPKDFVLLDPLKNDEYDFVRVSSNGTCPVGLTFQLRLNPWTIGQASYFDVASSGMITSISITSDVRYTLQEHQVDQIKESLGSHVVSMYIKKWQKIATTETEGLRGKIKMLLLELADKIED